MSVESFHHFTAVQKRALYEKIARALTPCGYLVITDYFAENDERELAFRQEYLRQRVEQGICGEEFYHFDTPLTVAHEKQTLLAAGFADVCVLAKWGATATLKAVKQ